MKWFALALAILLIPTAAATLLPPASTFHVDEPLLINVTPGTTLEIRAGESAYRYDSPAPQTLFIPRHAGAYQAISHDAITGALVEDVRFTVVAEDEAEPIPETQPRESSVQIVTVPSAPGNPAVISLTVPTNGAYDVLVRHGEDVNKFFDVKTSEITYIPAEMGQYTVELVDRDGLLWGVATFTLAPPAPAVPMMEEEVSLRDRAGRIRTATLQYPKPDDAFTSRIARAIFGQRENANLIIRDGPVRSISFRGLSPSSVNALAFDEVPAAKIDLGGQPVSKAFAINPVGVTFDNATFTARATGTALYKCASWDFAAQSCPGTWERVQELRPGETYSVDFDALDPGYAEIGVSSINTNQSIYEPGEIATISVVVLDTAGHLADALVTVNITAPDGTSTIETGVTALERGIYALNYSSTLLEGNYTLFVSALGANVDSTLASHFLVLSSYPYDIFREVPHTTDPWKEPFNASVRIISRNDALAFSFTESLPASFFVQDAGGANITLAGDRQLLTWEGLTSGSRVEYRVRPPFVSPALYEIGPGVVDNGIAPFTEARSWWFVVDPAVIQARVNATQDESGYVRDTNCGGTGSANVVLSDASQVGVGTVTTGSGREWQVYFDFDTSFLPDNAVITSATLSTYLVSENAGGGNDINVYSCDYGATLTNGDFNTALGTDHGLIFDGNYATGQYWSVDIGTSSINTAGTSQFCLRTDAGCEDAGNLFTIWDTGAFNIPFIEFNYTTPPNVTLITPPNGYANQSAPLVAVNFTCLITDDVNASNLSLYITNWRNTSFTLNGSCAIPSGANSSCTFLRNLTVGNYTWNCLGYDNYNLSDWGDSNNSLKINYTITPPLISFVNCSLGGGAFGSCANIAYGSTLSSLRSQCNSTSGGQVNNVSFIFTNVEDNRVYFNVTINVSSGGYWSYSPSNLVINDSGTFNLRTICRENPESENDTNYTVPWGNLTATLLNPGGSGYVERDLFFTFSARVNCTGGECGDINATAFHSSSSSPRGTGADGALTISSANTIINHYAYLTTNASSTNITVIVNGTGGFGAGDEVLIIQMQNGTGRAAAGNYEFATISRTGPLNLTFTQALSRNYTSGAFNQTQSLVTQVVRVPQYTDLGIRTGASITAPGWNTRAGGIIVFKATGHVENNGTITATGLGFHGGSYGIGGGAIAIRHGAQGQSTFGAGQRADVTGTAANVGGGGAGSGDTGSPDDGEGGGGASYGTAGTAGGSDGNSGDGAAGLVYGEPTLSSLLLGAGGGGGGADDAGGLNGANGGWGGGIIYITALNITNRGFIHANGTTGSTGSNWAGSGGGGAGGSIYLAANGIIGGTNAIFAGGGPGGPEGGAGAGADVGGDGGNGRIRLDADFLGGTSNPASGFNGSGPGDGSFVRISTSVTTPFYTNHSNPYNGSTLACLTAMSPGNSCDAVWSVNASGLSGTQRDFFAEFVSYRYPSNVTGVNTSAITLTIADTLPPHIHAMQCQTLENGWGSCANVDFGDTLQAVRANCSSPLRPTRNITFNFTNYPDLTQYFNANSTTNASILFTYDHPDILINNSGTFSLDLTCYDTEGSFHNTTSISVPWGNLSATLILPTSSAQREQNLFFSFTTQVNCTGGECGNINATGLHSASSSTYGTGSAGPLTVTTANNIINRYAYLTFNVTAGATTLVVNGTGGFAAGNEVLIIQMQNGTGLGTLGAYEFATISAAGGTTINLTAGTANAYYTGAFNATQSTTAQVVLVPHYTNVNVHTAGTIIPSPWNTRAGGIIVFKANGTIYVNGSITAYAAGFHGGSFGIGGASIPPRHGAQGQSTFGAGQRTDAVGLVPNVGGGGAGSGDTGAPSDGEAGGGASYGTLGTSGGSDGNAFDGLPGLTYGDEQLIALLMGAGGGGGGADNAGGLNGAGGGNGGGIVFLYGQKILAQGRINATGQNGIVGNNWAGSGGGGAGGSIYLLSDNITFTNGVIGTTGGVGGAAGGGNGEPGGDGGSGRIRLDATTISGSSNPAAGFTGSAPSGSGFTPISIVVGDSPFYTITANPLSNLSLACLSHLISGRSCETTWSVNATGAINSTSAFYGLYAATEYSPFVSSAQTSLVNITIVERVAPVIGAIQCQTLGEGWGSCVNANYGDTLLAVRANCTSQLHTIVNATFNLSNTEHRTQFFFGNATSNESTWFIFNNTDFVISQSGTWNLTATCLDDGGSTATNTTNWTVPWGTLGITWNFPLSNVNVTQFTLTNFSVNVTCSGGECGNVNATLDPTSFGNGPTLSRIQRGRLNLASGATTDTVTIDAVNVSSSLLIFNYATDDNTASPNLIRGQITGSTTIQFDRAGSGIAVPIVWTVVEFSSGARVQRGSETSSANTETFGIATPIATNQSFLVATYENVGSVWGNDDFQRFRIADASNVEISSPATIDDQMEWQVAEFFQGVRAERNIGTLGAGTSSALIALSTPANISRSFVSVSGDASGNALDDAFISAHFVNSTHIRVYRAATGVTVNYAWEVVEFSDRTLVHSGTVALTGTTSSVAVPLPDIVVNRTFAFLATYQRASTTTFATDDNPGTGYFMANITNSSALLLTRGIDTESSTANVSWFAIEFREPEIKSGPVSTILGDTPFFTIDPNPQNGTFRACLLNLSSGSVCTVSWRVNATGDAGSTHPFFATANSTSALFLVPSAQTYTINVTIIENEPPAISLVSISPDPALNASNITCSFTASDPNPGDSISVNVSWYRNGTLAYSWNQPANAGSQTNATLNASLTQVNDLFICGITPTDSVLTGTQVNSSPVLIYLAFPPRATQMECFENNTIWHTCNNIAYGDIIAAVRGNCSSDVGITQANFTLVNIPDNRTFFSNITTTQLAGYYTFDNDDFTVQDSGQFNLTLYCTDTLGITYSNTSSWEIPWGVLQASLIEPTDDALVDKDKFFSFQAQVVCAGGECGHVNATLDPSETRPTLSRVMNGTALMTGTTLNVAIPSVNLSSSILYFSMTVDDPNPSPTVIRGQLSSATNIQFSRDTATATANIHWYVVEFSKGVRVYRGSSTLSTDPETVNIGGTVVMNRSFVIASYQNAGSTFGNDDYQRVQLSSTTQIEISSPGEIDDTVDWQVVEFLEGLYVRRGIVALGSGTTTATADFAPANLNKTFATVTWYSGGNGVGVNFLSASFINSSRLLIHRETGTGVALSAAWEVVEFTGQEEVRRGSAVFTGTDTEADITIPAVTYRDSVPFLAGRQFAGTSSYTADDNPGTGWFTVNLTNATNIHLRRGSAASATSNVSWYAVQFARAPSKGGPVSTVSGTLPFYTTNANPQGWPNLACLANMTNGNACTVSWQVNATGDINTTHVFYVTFNSSSYYPYLPFNETRHINITISDSSLVPPVVTLSAPANGAYLNKSAISLACNATDNLGLRNITLYGNFSAGNTFGFNQTRNITRTANATHFNLTLADGRYLWNCLAYDINNNDDWGNANFTVIVDTTQPTISLIAPPNGTSSQGTEYTFNFTAFDALDNSLLCNLTLNGAVQDANFNAISGAVTARPLAGFSQGTYAWNVTCDDEAANRNTSLTYVLIVSDVPPSVVLLTPTNSFFNFTNITLSYNASDNNNITNATLFLNGIANKTNYTVINNQLNYFSLDNLTEGIYTWTVNVSDISDLTAQAIARTFTIDHTRPTISYLNPLDAQTLSNDTIFFNFTVTDNLDASLLCNITVNGSVVSSAIVSPNGTIVTEEVTGFADGLHYWNITCIDDAQNVNVSVSRTFEMAEPPLVVLTRPADNYSQPGSTFFLNYTATDNSDVVSCDLLFNGVLNVTDIPLGNGNESTFILAGVAEGRHNWTVNCTDTAGLWYVAEPRRFTRDATAPTVSLVAPPFGQVFNSFVIDFNFTVVDNLDSTLLCNLTVDLTYNLTNFLVPNGTFNASALNITVDGQHFWNVTCVDDGGNRNTSLTYNFSTENPPIVVLQSPTGGHIQNWASLNLSYFVSDSAGISNASLILNGLINETDDDVDNGETNFFTLLNLLDGIYTWTVNATDLTGLVGTDTPRNFTIDTRPPLITLNYPGNLSIVSTNNVTFNFTAIDNITSTMFCNVTLNGSVLFANLSTQNNTPRLASSLQNDGVYAWQVACLDVANNTGLSVQHIFDIIAPPEVTLLTPLNNSRTTLQNFNFTFIANDASGIANCTLIFDGVANQTINDPALNENVSFQVLNVPEGLHNWTVACVDNPPDLNEYSPPPYYFRIDQTGPNINLNTPLVGETLNFNNVSFNYTAYDSDLINLTCTIFVSDPLGTRNASTINISGFNHNVRIDNLSDGDHSWNVTCVDDLGNANTSVNRIFTINQPDLVLFSSGIQFNNTNPLVNASINITANISNIGGIAATNAVVSFWDGHPSVGGIFIGNDTATLTSNASRLYSVVWNITEGLHTIFISADPYGAIQELNETNNNASINISTLISRINSPPNASLFNFSAITVNFTIADFNGSAINYTIFDGSTRIASGFAPDNVSYLVNLTLGDGPHTVRVQALDRLGRARNSTPFTYFVDLLAPATVFQTQNDTWFSDPTPPINFTLFDNLSVRLNYTLFVSGAIDSTGNTTNASLTQVNLSALTDGTYLVIVQASDEAGNVGNSTALTIHVDTHPPQPFINTSNLTRFNTPTPTISFNITDNLSTSIGYQFFVGTNANTSGSTTNTTPTFAVLTGVPQGYSNLTLRGVDLAGNAQNGTPIQIYVDSIPPSITLFTPANNSNHSTFDLQFNFTATDLLSPYLYCNLTVDGQVLDGNINATNGALQVRNVTIPSAGSHLWNVVCVDDLGNSNTSLTYRFNILPPDLAVFAANITLNNSAPIEGESVNITVRVSNIGYVSAFNGTVQFWDGFPPAGVQIGGNFTVNITVGNYAELSVVWNATVGTHTLAVLADPGNLLFEANETNNNASVTLVIGSYDIRFGNITGLLAIDDSINRTVYTWQVGNFTGTNIFAIDADETPYFATLQALGRNLSNASEVDDFAQLDLALGSTNYSDSINRSYLDSGAPVALKNFTIFDRNVYAVPVVNSTNSSNFVTGLLWDTRNSSSYTGSQAVYVVTEVNQESFGRCGLCDFELRIPTNLKSLRPAEQSTVTIYVEIT